MRLKHTLTITLLVVALVPALISSAIDLGSMVELLGEMRKIPATTDLTILRLEQHLHSQIIYDLIALSILMVLGIVTSWILASHLARPMVRLSALSRRLTDGDFTARSHMIRNDEIGDLAKAFDSIGPALADRMRMAESLGLARRAQQYLLRTDQSPIQNLDIQGLSWACDETGGDYYDVINLKTKTLVVLGDVCGHGIGAALQMATSRALLRGLANDNMSLAQHIKRLNQGLGSDLDEGQFITLFAATINKAKTNHNLTWISAGHEPALLYDPQNKKCQALFDSNLPLGLDTDYNYPPHRLTLNSGQILAILSDGIGETANQEGQFYGRTPVETILEQQQHQPASTIARAILDDVKRFGQSLPSRDDQTIVIVKAC